jgi:hypothetical protein
MKYMLLIQYGDTPVPPSEEWNRLSQDEQKAVFAGYQAVNETPGVTPEDPGCTHGRISGGSPTQGTVTVEDAFRRRAAPCPRPPLSG